MTLVRWKELFDALGMLAIIASLIFVGLQVRQDRVIARSELFTDTIMLHVSLNQSIMDSPFAKVFAKMINSPDELAFEESVQLDAFLEQVVSMYSRECFLLRREIFVECKNIVRFTAPLYFGNPYAQSWWRQNGPRPALPEWIDAEIESVSTDYYRRRIENTKSGIQ